MHSHSDGYSNKLNKVEVSWNTLHFSALSPMGYQKCDWKCPDKLASRVFTILMKGFSFTMAFHHSCIHQVTEKKLIVISNCEMFVIHAICIILINQKCNFTWDAIHARSHKLSKNGEISSWVVEIIELDSVGEFITEWHCQITNCKTSVVMIGSLLGWQGLYN
jgi:hypothetical protein